MGPSSFPAGRETKPSPALFSQSLTLTTSIFRTIQLPNFRDLMRQIVCNGGVRNGRANYATSQQTIQTATTEGLNEVMAMQQKLGLGLGIGLGLCPRAGGVHDAPIAPMDPWWEDIWILSIGRHPQCDLTSSCWLSWSVLLTSPTFILMSSSISSTSTSSCVEMSMERATIQTWCVGKACLIKKIITGNLYKKKIINKNKLFE